MSAGRELILERSAGQVAMRLTEQELRVGAAVGVGRNIEAITKGAQHRFGGQNLNGWSMHIYGALAELAVAKFLRIYWSGLGSGLIGPTRFSGDVGPVEVRHSGRDDACLLLHPDDDDDRAFVLVTGAGPDFVLRGWSFAGAVKSASFWETKTGRPCYFVPQSALLSMDQLKQDIK